MDTASFDELAARVDELRDRVNHSDDSVRALLQETLDAITEFNRQGLITLVHMMREDERAGEILYESVERPEVMALFVSHGIIRSDRTLDVLQVYEQIRPHLIASSIEMSVEEVRDDVAYVKFAAGCSAADQPAKDEIMGILRQRVAGLRDVVEVVDEPSSAFVAVDTIRVGPPA
jgi:Fe-S cluster biogenesis protein NfuA